MELYKHQKELIDKNPKKHGLFFETGTGKTLTAIKLAEQNVDKFLVICPKSIKEQWEEQINKFLGKEMQYFVITKETFRRDWNKLPEYPCLIIDECHYFSGHKSQMHKALVKYIDKWNPTYIYGLTATPYLSSIMNLYSLERILGYNPNWMYYNQKYFTRVKMGRRFIPVQKSGLEKEVARICNKIGTVVKMEDCIDVPPQIFQTEYFELTADQKKGMAEVVDLQPIVRFTKYHQICGGALKGDGYTEDKEFASEKMQRVLDLTKEHKKVVIVCRYNNEIKALHQRLKTGLNCVVINGMTKDKHEAIKTADSLPQCVVLVQADCGVGWELPSFPLMVFYSMSFSLVSYLQMIGRIQRINAIKKNVYLSLIVKGTIDEDVYKSIMNKKNFDIEIYAKERV